MRRSPERRYLTVQRKERESERKNYFSLLVSFDVHSSGTCLFLQKKRWLPFGGGFPAL